MRTWVFVAVAACASARPMTLRKVILYQNGIGYFERTGHVTGRSMRLALGRGELDDVLKTLTVVDKLGAGVSSVDVQDSALDVRLASGAVHDVSVGYAVPTPAWKAAYRVVLDDNSGLLQAWAMVNNQTQEDWHGISLTLATGAPMSYALDLHTPEYVKRPDANGHLVAPAVSAPIAPVTQGAGDRDGDGIVDSEDRCPDVPSTDESDGCPAPGHLVTVESSVVVLRPIEFAAGADSPMSRDMVGQVAAVLAANPDIAELELAGHASADERDPWGLATRRANAVRDALVAAGVDGARLRVVPYGATQPLDGTHDRRVELVIVKRAEQGGTLDAPAMATSVHAATKPADVAGTVRYVLTAPVTLRRGGSAMVPIVDKPVDATDVYLFRPDAAAPGSDRHPYRAARVANTTGYTLEPGPIAMYARGAFVGDSLMGRLGVGETAWIPYAVDGATTVTVEPASDERPLRVVAVSRGVVTVETTASRTTRYTVAAGREPAHTIYIHHAKAAGFAAPDLPPGTLDQGDAYLVPLPLSPGKTSTLVVVERQPRNKTIELSGAHAADLDAYLEGSQLTPAALEALRGAIALRAEVGSLDIAVAQLRTRIGDLASRAEEIRRTLRSIDKLAAADDLRKKLVASLAAATADGDTLARQLADNSEQLATTRAKLEDTIRDLDVASHEPFSAR